MNPEEVMKERVLQKVVAAKQVTLFYLLKKHTYLITVTSNYIVAFPMHVIVMWQWEKPCLSLFVSESTKETISQII